MANIIHKDPSFELTSLRDRVNQLFNQAAWLSAPAGM
jgi:hypothetical protein